jgi:nitroreductase
MMIAPESLRVGSCLIGFARFLSTSECFSEYAKELHIPNGYAISNGITLGYKASENPTAPERKQDLVSYILWTETTESGIVCIKWL